MRRNKRVDTLVITLADLLLPYYRIWQDSRVKHAKDYTEATQSGYDIWQSGLVQHMGGEAFQVNDMSKYIDSTLRVLFALTVIITEQDDTVLPGGRSFHAPALHLGRLARCADTCGQ